MVQFNIQQDNGTHHGDHGEKTLNGRKRQPVTPHPNKKHRSSNRSTNDGSSRGSINNDNLPFPTEEDGLEDISVSLAGGEALNHNYPCLSLCLTKSRFQTATKLEASLKMTVENINENSDCDDDEEDKEVDEMSAYWKMLVEDSGEKEVPNLAIYLPAKSKREEANERFTRVLDECMQGLNDGLEEMLQDLVVPVHEEQRERVDRLEEDIVETMKANFGKRRTFQRQLDAANKAWKEKHELLMQTILRMDSNPVCPLSSL